MTNGRWCLLVIGTAFANSPLLDIADPVFGVSWVSEVPFKETLKPSDIWEALFTNGTPMKTSLNVLNDLRELWTDEYLIRNFGSELVRTEPDRENRTVDYCGLKRLGEVVKCGKSDYEYTKRLSVYYTLRDFIGNLTSRQSDHFGRYVITALPDSMAKDLPFLPGFGCGLRRRFYPLDAPEDPAYMTQVSELNFWLSNGSTYSAIHYDMNQQIMCQISGRKEWRFWDLRTELKNIPMWSGFYPHTMSSDDSPIDPLDVDLLKYPQFVNARWMNTTLNPGECILIPSRHALHFVRSYPGERNMGFSVHVSSDYPRESMYDCDEEVIHLNHSNLIDFPPLWPFPGDSRESGFNTVRMGHGDWKGLALFALQKISRGVSSLSDAVSELTNGVSKRNKRLQQLLADAPVSDMKELFNFGPLWREIYTVVNRD